jgi:hypothetical protein
VQCDRASDAGSINLRCESQASFAVAGVAGRHAAGLIHGDLPAHLGDLSWWARTLFWALLGLIVFGILLIFVSIPQAHVIYAVAGLGIFGAFTIVDVNRLRRSNPAGAVPIAASIFLDIFNVFLLLLQLFGGGRD